MDMNRTKDLGGMYVPNPVDYLEKIWEWKRNGMHETTLVDRAIQVERLLANNREEILTEKALVEKINNWAEMYRRLKV